MAKKSEEVVEVFIDGTGGQAGAKSGFAWFIPGVAAKVEWRSGLTCNEAEHRALLSAVAALPKGSGAVIKSDSELVVKQFAREYRVHDQAALMNRSSLARVSEMLLVGTYTERGKACSLKRKFRIPGCTTFGQHSPRG